METKKVYTAISNVMGDLAEIGISKSKQNRDQGFAYRGIDDVYNVLSACLVRHKLLILPHVLSTKVTQRETRNKSILWHCELTLEYEFICCEDGSSFTLPTFAEASDMGDKSYAKALAVGYKYLMLQVFCVPIEGHPDADETTPLETIRAATKVVTEADENATTAEERVALFEAVQSSTDDDALRSLATAFMRLGMTDGQRKSIASALVEGRAKYCQPEGFESMQKMSRVFADRKWITKKDADAAIKLADERLTASAAS